MRPETINFPAAGGRLLNTGGCVTFITSHETTGTAGAEIRLWDGSTNAGTLVAVISLNAGESTRDDITEHHLTFRTGLYLEVVSGAIEGSVSVLVEHQCEMAWRAKLAQIIETLGKP
jgi:hypothetical protein